MKEAEATAVLATAVATKTAGRCYPAAAAGLTAADRELTDQGLLAAAHLAALEAEAPAAGVPSCLAALHSLPLAQAVLPAEEGDQDSLLVQAVLLAEEGDQDSLPAVAHPAEGVSRARPLAGAASRVQP